jgi:membrane-bound lytic murein transglycosylase D
MMAVTRGILAAAGVVAALGCATRMPPAPAPPPPPPPATSLPIGTFSGPVGPALPVVPDQAAALVGAVEREFAAGRDAWDKGRTAEAREHFDRAVVMLIDLPQGARSDKRLSAELDSLVDRITSIELAGLRTGAGLIEAPPEPAAIDELLTAAAVDRPTPAATTAETVAADLAKTSHDIPIPQNAKVLQYIELFQGRLHDFMQEGLDRGQQYLPMIMRTFQEEKVPLDLAYLPLVESAFKTNALSRASARGMWQFMQGTAREHDLAFSWFVDERGDPEKATRAAAQYLKTLNEFFDGDWHFALASYNAGPGRLQTAAKRSKKTDFWAIASSTRYLPRETREYVPMVLAAIVIARNPELYGFRVGASAPLVYETVTTSDALPLDTIAEWAEVPVNQLRELNPALRRGVTPSRSTYELKVPVGTAATIQTRLETYTDFEPYRFHVVKPGETMNSIAKKYGITAKQLRDMNDLRTSKVKARQELRIPISTRPVPASTSAATTGATRSATPKPIASNANAALTYRVRSGDTLYSIARQFDTTVEILKRLNGLPGDRIKIGDRLTVPR